VAGSGERERLSVPKMQRKAVANSLGKHFGVGGSVFC